MNARIEAQALRESPTLADSFDAFHTVRAHSVALMSNLSAEDCCVQSMPDASPVKWHLAHTTWFFETFILERFERNFTPHHPAFRMLFNSYYNGVGERHVRAQRGNLTRPSHTEVLAYRADVDRRMGALLSAARGTAADADTAAARLAIAGLVGLGLQHEQQHQELIVTDVLHLLSTNPLQPALWQTAGVAAIGTPAASAGPMVWHAFDAGIVSIGHAADSFSFDNETPRHRQFTEAHALASRLVTNGEYREFIEDGGYRDPALWLSEGWDWVCSNQLELPLYWRHDDASGWQEFGPYGLQRLDPHAAVSHVSLYEADAFARWAGARLPTEAEWEAAAAGDDTGSKFSQLFDTRWQWTTSSYAPYPGYAPATGALGEYNGKFMINQYVLRGSSCATPPGHSRPTYRNFFPADARWQFSGIRLARSLPAQ